MERIAELDLEIVYRLIVKNVVVDVLSNFGVEGALETTVSAWYSLDDRSIRYVVYDWLNVVAKHLDFDACATAAVEALS